MLKSSRWLTWTALGLGLGIGYLAGSADLKLAAWVSGSSPPASHTNQPAARETGPAQVDRTDKPSAGAGGKPNIVFLMADNLGYGGSRPGRSKSRT